MNKNPFTPPVIKCETCRFWDPTQLDCRRYAPRPHHKTTDFIWPTTFADDWCGEWSEAIGR